MTSDGEPITFWSEAFDFTLSKREQQRIASDESCIFMDTYLAGGGNVEIPCFKCSGFNSLSAYIRHFKQEVSDMVASAYPYIPRSSVDEMGRSFALFIDACGGKYVCPHDESGGEFMLELFIDPRATTEDDMAVEESFEAAAPMMKPATRESVEGLFAFRSQQQQQQIQQFQCGECVICMDRIATSGTALTMPCSHVFHEDCLVQWLKNSHVCPLCRYEMPTAHLVETWLTATLNWCSLVT